jgi:hypothetical protein
MRARFILPTLALPLMLAACGGGGDSAPPPPAPGPPPVAAAYNVQTCLDQVIRPGMTTANFVVPDTIKLDMSQPTSFPNGRHPTDSAIDRTLAFLFIDVPRHGLDGLARLPLGPQANDAPFRADFPYLAPPNGAQPPPGQGSSFNFRTDPVSAYAQVDRMGMPAIATAVIGSSQKNNYNDDSPAVDGTRKYVTEITTQLTALTNALADDFTARGLTLCARPAS